MDHTRNETIRALAAASAAEIRSRPARALAAVSGEIEYDQRGALGPSTLTHCTERELPLERTPNYYTGEHRSEIGGAS